MAIAKRRTATVFGLVLGLMGCSGGLGNLLFAQMTIAEPKCVENLDIGRSVIDPSRGVSESNATQLPVWDSGWAGVDRPSVLTENDCLLSPAPQAYDPIETPPGMFLPATRPHLRRAENSSDLSPRSQQGQLNQAYRQSYRHQMPSLKEMHPDDFQFVSGTPNVEPDLFGACRTEKVSSPALGSRGQWFGRYEALVAWPYYSNGHPGLTLQAGAVSIAEPFDYNLLIGNRAVVGWESKKGPGGVFQFTDLFAISEQMSVGAVGGNSGVEGNLIVPGLPIPFSISALPGERLEATAREHLTSYRPTAFKRVYFPISTITGGFGLDYTVLRQSVSYARFANLATPLPSETLAGHRRFSGIGPTFDIEYHRPIGHTPLAMLGGAQMGVLYGSDRWSAAQNGILIYQQNSHRVITNATVRLGVEWSQAVGSRPDSRVFARFTIEGQNWLNAGNFSNSESTLGFLSGNFAVGATY
jgi:hypothetical protein